jgi:hypothetical protein
VANALNDAYMQDGDLYLGYPVTVGDVRQPFNRRCYLNRCEERFTEFVVGIVTNALLQIGGGAAFEGGSLILKFGQAAAKYGPAAAGRSIWNSSPCMNKLAGEVADHAVDLSKEAEMLLGQTTNTVSRTNSQLVQEIGRRAEAWGVREGLGKGPVSGTYKHGYARDMLERYQRMFGDRGLTPEVRYLNQAPWQEGLGTRGSVILDVIEGNPQNPTMIFDYKFGNAHLTPYRINQINTVGGFGGQVPIQEVKP